MWPGSPKDQEAHCKVMSLNMVGKAHSWNLNSSLINLQDLKNDQTVDLLTFVGEISEASTTDKALKVVKDCWEWELVFPRVIFLSSYGTQ